MDAAPQRIQEMNNVNQMLNYQIKKIRAMKSIRNIKMHTLAAALFAGSLFTACERRELVDDYMESALIPVRIDWSVSGVPVDEMHRASVWLFPQNGGAPLEYRLEGNLTYREIAVPVGVYSVLAFNETIEENDWKSIAFTGTSRYETFAAVAVPDDVRGFYTRSEDLPLIGDPDPIAAWSLDRFEVTPEMVTKTRYPTTSKSSLESEAPDLTTVKPLPRFERLVVTARVGNLSGSMQATGTIDGMAGGVYMASGEKISEPAAHAFILNGRVYDANGKDGTTTRTWNIFGRLPVEPAKHSLNIDFLLTDGTLHPQESFDATHLIVTKTDGIVRTHIIDLGYGDLDGDRQIALPDTDMEAGISVDGWDEVIIPVK